MWNIRSQKQKEAEKEGENEETTDKAGREKKNMHIFRSLKGSDRWLWTRDLYGIPTTDKETLWLFT